MSCRYIIPKLQGRQHHHQSAFQTMVMSGNGRQSGAAQQILRLVMDPFAATLPLGPLPAAR
jgi:hypothetical protein